MTNTSLGRLAGRGAVVNLVFGIGLQLLAVAQAVLIPRLLGADAIGLFALASAGVGIGLTLKGVDVAGKVVQERDVDLYTAYGVAMTLELGMATLMLLVMMGVAPILAAVYHRPQLWPVTSVLALTLFEAALLSIPASIPYREMRFLKRNLFTAVGPLVTFVVTLALALSGAGIWSLVAGTVAGTAVAGALLLRVSSIRPHFSWDGAVVRRFLRFGIPPWLGQMVTMVAGWGSVAVVAGTIGIAGLAYVNLAQGWAYMILQLDAFMADAVFPALCAVRDSDDRLRRTFIVTNRLSIAWGATVGLGLLLFAAPAVHLLLGPKWHPAVLLIQASAVAVVINAIGYNWKNYYSARGDTRPTLVTNLAASAWLAMVFIPLTLTLHLGGAAIAIVIMAVGGYIQRQIYVSRFFPGLHLLPMVWRELCAVGAAGGVTGIARLAGWEPNGWASFVLQGTLFVALCVAAGWPLCGPLVRIVLGYVRSGSGAPTVESIESGPEPLRIPNRFAFPLGVAADP
ncbi:MAG TPA: oligosaccharide flippase family protein, partial [Acidimicrobiales bacterium]|nr:oligosaccharide flippase family protein [Acidimicrobiales bacterium]